MAIENCENCNRNFDGDYHPSVETSIGTICETCAEHHCCVECEAFQKMLSEDDLCEICEAKSKGDTRAAHDQHSAEAAEAWALQNLNTALDGVCQLVNFECREKFEAYVRIIANSAWATQQKSLAAHKAGDKL